MKGLHIHGAAGFTGEVGGDLDLLKEEIRRYTRETFRRGNRFILLALLGALRCVHRQTLEADTAVYLTTEHGNLCETAAVLDEIYTARSLPKPYGFINTMSNTAAFYLAQSLALRGRNITLSSQHLSFERGLELLEADFAGCAEKSALIGGVDVASLNGSGRVGQNHRGWPMVDGSGWFFIRSESEGACGAFSENRFFQDGDACRRWIDESGKAPSDVLSFGAGVGEEEAARWQAALHPVEEFDYLRDHGYSGSATACGAALFMDRFPGRTLLHMNRDERGHYSVLELVRY